MYRDVITEFRGRGDEVHVHPLNFTEFMSVYSGTKQDGWNEYMFYGGLSGGFSFMIKVLFVSHGKDADLPILRRNYRGELRQIGATGVAG